MNPPVSVTETARNYLLDSCISANKPGIKIQVKGGGCAGFSYGFTFEETKNDDDFDFAYDEVKVVVDAMSMQYLNGASIDYKEDLMSASFVINNPQASSTCGCGSSFAV